MLSRRSVVALALAVTLATSTARAQDLAFVSAGDVHMSMTTKNEQVTLGQFVCSAAGPSRKVEMQWLAFDRLFYRLEPDPTWKSYGSMPKDHLEVTRFSMRASMVLAGKKTLLNVVLDYADKSGPHRTTGAVEVQVVCK
jgi:hypothetical protein